MYIVTKGTKSIRIVSVHEGRYRIVLYNNGTFVRVLDEVKRFDHAIEIARHTIYN